MKIGWLHDYRLEECLGGAELTNERIIQHAPDWADIVRCYPGEMYDADAYILNNLTFFSPRELGQATGKPYIHFLHDLWHVRQAWQRGRRRQITEQADALVCLSELHVAAYREETGFEHDSLYVIPSAIDPAPFTEHRRQPYNALYIGALRRYKGLDDVVAWAAKNGRVDVYGRGPYQPQGENVVYKGEIPYERVPVVMGQYRRLVFFPQWAEPFGRTVAEAAMSGCEIVGNSNIGALTWGFETVAQWRYFVGTAHERFWEIAAEAWGVE